MYTKGKGRKGGEKGGKGGKGGKGKRGPPPEDMSSSCVLSPDMIRHYEGVFGPACDEDGVRNLMINYIPNKVTLDELRVIFSVYGPVEHLRLICDKVTHEPKGYGFVKYVYGASAYAAMLYLNGYQVLHKRLKISYADADQAASLIDHDTEMNMRWKSQLPRLVAYYHEFKDQAFAHFLSQHYAKTSWEASTGVGGPAPGPGEVWQ